MANYKNIVLGVLVLIIIGLVGFLFLRNPEKRFKEGPLPVAVEDSQVKNSNVETYPKDWIEYKNDEVGFSFWYPRTYGELDARTRTPISIPDGDLGKEVVIQSFQGYFSAKSPTSFWGGIPCWGCEPVHFVTKGFVNEATKKQPIFKTDSGIPVYELVKPCTQKDLYDEAENPYGNCAGPELIGYGQYLIKLNNDYNGFVFLGKAQEAEAILKTFELK